MVLLGCWVFPCGAELRVTTLDGTDGFSQAVLEAVVSEAGGPLTLAPLAEGTNLALGQVVLDEYSKKVPLSDGSVAVGGSEWISGTPNVFGRTFTVDLGLDRAINRVRILPGGTAEIQPEYFIRGYRLEASTEQRPEIWHRLAEQRANFQMTVDTRGDTTWSNIDALGKPVPRVGRYVKLTLIRQDRSNWVALGDIEVYGTGFANEGQLSGEVAFPGPVNIGRLRWQGETPGGTQVLLSARGRDDQGDEVWEKSSLSLYSGAEPQSGLAYRVQLATDDPLTTPKFGQLEVEWDPVLVARRVLGSVQPDTARKGEYTAIAYRVDLELGAGEHGVDLLQLGAIISVESVRFGGITLDHAWQTDVEKGLTQVVLEAPLRESGTVEILGQGLFLQDRTSMPVSVGSRAQEAADGYINWQNGAEASGENWTVRGVGSPPRLLSAVEIAPRPFSPFRDEQVGFEFVVGNLQQATEISLEIFSLNGTKVRRLSQIGEARAYRLAWDGRDRDGRIAAPGLYLYEVRVDAEDNAASRTGTLVVAY